MAYCRLRVWLFASLVIMGFFAYSVPSRAATGNAPTDNSTCSQGTPKASCNDATEVVVGKTKDGTGVCCLARTGSEATLYTIPISNPLAYNTVDELLTSIWGFLQAIIVILSLIMIVIGSIVYMTAGGNDSKLSTGKLIITASLIGLALALAAPSFLKEIGAILGWGDVNGSPADSAKSITEILTGILNFLLSVIGIIGIIMVVIGGLMYLSAAGDEDRINTGKSIVKYSLIGITVALAALVIISQITKFFGGRGRGFVIRYEKVIEACSRWRKAKCMMIPAFFMRGLAVFFVVSCGIFFDSSSVQAASFGVNLYADKLVIPPGGSATIDWTISYGSNPDFPYSCSGNFGNFMVSSPTGSGYASGVFPPVTPAGTTTYRVTCSSAGSVTPVTGEKTITVSSKPVVSLKANPAALPEVGGSTLISWKVDLATSCVATDGDARWRGLSGLPQGGGLTWDLTTTTQFSLECFNDAKASSGKQTIQVYVGPPCGNKIIDPGEQCDEGINNDDTCKKSECSSDCQYLGGQICSQVGKDPVCGNGILEETFDHGVSIGEKCDNGSADNGGCPKLCSGSCSENTCSGGMTVHLDAGGNGSAGEPPYMNPGYGSGNNAVKLGDAIPIYYTVANAVSCTASGEGFSPSKLAPSSDGIIRVTPTALGTYTWTLDCTDKNGQVLHRTDFYDVYSNLDVEILSFAATPKPVPFSSDGKVQFSWTGNNLGTCTISGATPSQVVDDNGGSATITYTPSQRKSYGAKGVTVTLNCKKGQSSEHSEVTVYFESDPALPPSVNFWINNNPGPSMTASSGAVLILSWEVSGAARCYSTNFLYKGKNEIVPPAPGIKPTSQVTFKTNTTYSLECWNAPEYGSLSTKKSIEVISGSGQTPPPLPSTPPVGGGGTPTPPLVPSPSADSPSLIPCGRNIDDKNTSDIDETKPCTLCHIVLGGQKLISWGLKIMAIIAITVIFAMGVLYILSAGNSSMMETAKGGMIASLIGFAVMLSAYLIVNVILTILVDTASPDKPFLNLTATQGYFNFACDITSNVNGK